MSKQPTEMPGSTTWNSRVTERVDPDGGQTVSGNSAVSLIVSNDSTLRSSHIWIR